MARPASELNFVPGETVCLDNRMRHAIDSDVISCRQPCPWPNTDEVFVDRGSPGMVILSHGMKESDWIAVLMAKPLRVVMVERRWCHRLVQHRGQMIYEWEKRREETWAAKNSES